MSGQGAATTERVPLSVAQEALWYLSLLVPHQVSYNETISIRKDGPLDLEVFRRAFNEIVRRHGAWRTTFDVDTGEPVQVLHAPDEWELPVVDLSDLPFERAERQAAELATTVSEVPYDLRRGPLLRPRLVRFPGHHHRLYLPIHHLVFDAVSVYRVVLPELVALYDAFAEGRPSPLSEPTTTYADYARFEQQWITTSRALRRLHYWRDRLSFAPRLALPLDHPRPEVARYRGGVVPFSIPAATVAKLRAGGRAVGATLFQVLATAWALLLGRYAGQDDVVFATAADLRQRPEFEAVVGYSVTPLVLRLDLFGAATFSELVVRLRNELLDGLDNLVPFERIVRELGAEAENAGNPVYQTMVILEPPVVAPDPQWSAHLMTEAPGRAVSSCRLDLELALDERPEGHIAGRLVFDTDLFERLSAAAMVEHWLAILHAVAHDPAVDPLSLPEPSEGEQLEVEDWNATTTERPSQLLHELVCAHGERTPDAVALRGPDGTLSYAELCRRAEDTAQRLVAAGVGGGDLVAFCAEPSAGLVADVLGALRAGAAYLLLDPTLPGAILQAVIDDAGPALVYADPSLGATLSGQATPISAGQPEGEGAAGPRPVEEAQEALCLHYDTAAEGEPRGVEMGQRAVLNLVRSVADEVGLGAHDTVLVLRPTLYEASALELWLGLSAGATVVLAPLEAATSGPGFHRVVTEERISFVHASAQSMRAIVDSGMRPTRGLTVLCGGELDGELAERLLDRCRVLFAGFGTPETTLYATVGLVTRGRPVTVGRPLANNRVAVVDSHHRPVPPGVVGQLLVSGLGVAGARSTASAPEASFVEDPFGRGAARATGRRARWRLGGEVELVAADSRSRVALDA